jgi:Uma2 family endonuclease
MALRIPHRTWTADEYEKMGRAGILRPDEDAVLVRGEIVTQKPARHPRRWTFEEYLRLAEEGIIGYDERTELIDGEIVPMSPTGRRHKAVALHLNTWLNQLLAGRALVSMQDTLRLAVNAAPEPDITVLRHRADFYLDQEAGPADVLLVIEVAESSLSLDRGVKRDLYAAAGIPEYWLVDLRRGAVVVYRAPADGDYREERQYRPGESWISASLDGREIRAEDVLGPAAKK